MANKYDLLLSGGEVIDPGQGIHKRCDVALSGGKVALIAEGIPKEQAKKVEDVSGKLVTPGLIDIHGHFFHSFMPWQFNADEVCLPNGVTTAVDGGSSGYTNFAAFREFIISQSQTRLYCFLNLSALGFTTVPFMPELGDLTLADVGKTVECINQNRDVIVGIKIRVAHDSTGLRNALPALEMALQAAQETQTHVMVHITDSPIPLREIFDRLRPGDIACHIFNGREPNILDWNHKVRPEIRAAAQRGVIMDGACAQSHTDFNVARVALEQGLLPNILSTDIVNAPVLGITSYNLIEVMSIFLALGLPLDEVIRCNTSNAAAAIGKSQELGSLRVGATGDVTVLQIQEGDFTFTDWTGNELKTKQKLVPVMTVHNGQVWNPASTSSQRRS